MFRKRFYTVFYLERGDGRMTEIQKERNQNKNYNGDRFYRQMDSDIFDKKE